jgi:hypothetical protein
MPLSSKGRNEISVRVRSMVRLLVRSEWSAIEDLTKGVRLTAIDLRNAISEYGQTLVEVPDADLDNIEITEVIWEHSKNVEHGIQKPTYLVDVDLHTEEEGVSDLTLQLRFTEGNEGAFDISIDDLHVL